MIRRISIRPSWFVVYSLWSIVCSLWSFVYGLRNLLALLLLVCLVPTALSAAPAPGRIVLLVVPGLRAEDLNRPELPTLRRLLSEGASGWMVCRAARVTDPDLLRPDGRDTTDSLMLTLGCGARAIVGPESDGIVAPTPHALHVLPYPPPDALAALKAANARLAYTVPIGALGDLAHKAGLHTAALGNMDSDRPDRSLTLLVMDANGQVDEARERLTKNLACDTAPFGLQANTQQMLADYDALDPRDGLRAIAFGDLYRADRYGPLCMPAIAAQHRATALQALDAFLAQLQMRLIQDRASRRFAPVRLILLSPAPADSTASPQDRLAPILFWGDGIAAGRLDSPSTRRPGLVVNTDLTATVADWLQQPLPSGAVGRPIQSVAVADAPPASERLAAAHADWVRRAELQNALGGLPTVQCLLVVCGLLTLRHPRWRRIRIGIAIAIVALPLGMLALPIFNPPGQAGAATLLLLFVALCVGIAWRNLQGSERVFTALCAALLALIGLDLLTGLHLLHNAWMSYSALDGSRYYGIGNEYMGAVIGAACVLFSRGSWSVERGSRSGDRESPAVPPQTEGSRGIAPTDEPATPAPATQAEESQAFTTNHDPRTTDHEPRSTNHALFPFLLLFMGLLLVMGAPALGAKVGAIPSAGIAFAVALLTAYRGRLILRDLLVILAVPVVLLLGAALLDAHGGQSHFIRALTGEGGGSLLSVLHRKALMERHLLRHSPWSLTLLACICALLWIRTTRWRRLFVSPKGPAARAAFAGIVTGAFASLLFNDAGVLAATMVLLYGCAWALLSASSRRETAQPSLSSSDAKGDSE